MHLRNRANNRLVAWPLELLFALIRFARFFWQALNTGVFWLLSWLFAGLARLVRFFRRTPRTAWGITPIVNSIALAAADRQLGLQSDTIVFSSNHLQSRFSRDYAPADSWFRSRGRYFHSVFRHAVLLMEMLRLDQINLYFDQGILPPVRRYGVKRVELRAWQRAGVAVRGLAFGADVRTRETATAAGEPNACTLCPTPGRYCICDADEQAESMAPWLEFDRPRFAMLDMIDQVPGAANFNYWPVETSAIKARPPEGKADAPLRIFHATNHRFFKGTDAFLGILENLQGQGCPIEIDIADKVSREDVLARMADCDLVIDQFLIGAHGYFALEAMAMGKPVMAFLRHPERMRAPELCPVINCRLEILADVIKRFAADRDRLRRIGLASRAYVEAFYSTDRIAIELAGQYRAEAHLNPSQLRAIRDRAENLEADNAEAQTRAAEAQERAA